MKLNVNLPTPYDIVIEKGALAKAGDWVATLWQPQKLLLSRTIVWAVYMLKQLN